MKNFRSAPLSLAVASMAVFTPSMTSQAATSQATNSRGDLVIYQAGDALNGLDASGTTNPLKRGNAILFMLDMSSVDGVASVTERTNRLNKMIKTIKYLVENDNGFDEDTMIGVGTYPSTTVHNKNLSADGLTGGVFVPIGRLGPHLSKLRGAEKKNSHRQKILNYLNGIQASGTGLSLSPMAPAYAEAGAYMMGTTTSRLTRNKESLPGYEDTVIYRRVLRERNGKWEYCDPENTQQYVYEKRDAKGKVTEAYVRQECPETLPNGKPGWVSVSEKGDGGSQKVAPTNWNGTGAPNEKQIADAASKGWNKFDLMWYFSRPYGVGSGLLQRGTDWSPKYYDERKYAFNQDSFQNRKNFSKTITPDDKTWGSKDTYTYYYDASDELSKILEPVVRYRAIRQKFVGYNHYDKHNNKTPTRLWQYCSKEKSELVNYVYSSYRLMCNEEDWVDIGVYDGANGWINKAKTDANAKKLGLRWNHGYFPNITRGGRPHGIIGRHSEGGQSWQYTLDPMLNPFDGWQYWYDASYKNNLELPPTLLSGYSSSGIRNSPPEVRRRHSYRYDQPNYLICKPNDDIKKDSRVNRYQSNPKNRTLTNTVIENAAIYFMTAGIPSSAALAPVNEMNKSLKLNVNINGTPTNEIVQKGVVRKFSARMSPDHACDRSGLNGGPGNGHWGCMGAYSRRLNSTNNHIGRAVKTGVFLITPAANKVSFGGNCSVAADVNNVRKQSYQNACKLGSNEYGGGGFHATDTNDTPQAVRRFAEAIKAQTSKLSDNPLDVKYVPTSPIQVPTNPLLSGHLSEYGYLPLLAPQSLSKSALWQGNLRQYKSSTNGYVDKDGNSPYSRNPKQVLSSTTKDFWSNVSVASEDKAGGAFAKIPSPTSQTTETPRKVYLSSPTSRAELSALSPAAHAPSDSNIKSVRVASGDPANPVDNTLLQRLLLNYMGYNITQYNQNTKTADIIKTFDSGKNKSMGGVVHSLPVSMVSKATITDGQYVPEETYVLFGAMDNALHVVKQSDGTEVLSYFPREVLGHKGQYKSIVPGLTADETKNENMPSFGVDAPWETYASYSRQVTADKLETITADKLYAFGGARMGAKAYYGLDLTGIHKQNGFKPKQTFTITPTTSSAFKRLGYGWGKPVVTKIKWQGKPRLVVILSGGYDTSYDKTDTVRKRENTTRGAYTPPVTLGNAIYVIDIQDKVDNPNPNNPGLINNPNFGKPLIVASQNANSVGKSVSGSSSWQTQNNANDYVAVINDDMKHSIPGGVKVLDRDADEMADHIYFADLEGQVFRMDINNTTSKGADSNLQARVVKLADLNPKTNGTYTAPGPRFYETPTVTIQTNKDGKRFATVSVASGDRSNPLAQGDKADVLFTLYDKDVADAQLYHGLTVKPPITATTPNLSLGVQSLTAGRLYTTLKEANNQAYFDHDGWMAPLTRHGKIDRNNNYSHSTNIKAMGPLSAIGNRLYLSAYNPDKNDEIENACIPHVKGETETHQYCLPYGICVDGSGDQYQRFTTGKGILLPSFGSLGNDTTARSILTQDAGDGNTGGSVAGNHVGLNKTAPKVKSNFELNGHLRPLMWYDIQSKKHDDTP